MKQILAFCLAVILVGCSAVDGFSVDKNARLSFPSDTISFDSVFAGVQTPTYMFSINNRGDGDLRILSAKLRGGVDSDFRFNIDGHSGPDVSNVDVRHSDSVFVLVDMLPVKNGTSRRNDYIDFMLEGGAVQSLCLDASVMNVDMVRCLELKNDTSLCPNSSLLVYDSLVVAEGATLTIPSGVVLYFHSKAKLRVDGVLNVKGTLDAPVVFRGDRLDNMLTNIPYDRVSGQWGGVELSETSFDNHFDYLDIHSSNYGLRCLSSDTSRLKFFMTNSVIHNVKGNSVELNESSAVISNSELSNAAQNCIYVNGGRVRVYQSTIANFYPWSLADVALFAKPSERSEPSISLYNSIVTGYLNDEILIQLSDTVSAADLLIFRNSLLRTPTTDSIFVNCVSDDSENKVSAADNFPQIDTSSYFYRFSLSPDSKAVGLGDSWILPFLPFDRLGRERNAERIDAGCYQSCVD